MDAILKALKLRKSISPFGYGLGTAENHVKRFTQAASSKELKQFGVSSPAAISKEADRAAKTLTFCSPDMVRDEKVFTSSNDMKDIMPEGVNLPEKTMFVMQHVLTTDRVDRDNDILRTSGAKLDPKAPLLWQHMHSMPIGGVLFEVNHTGSELKVASALLDMNEITHDAGILVMANMLRFSHGFRVLDFEEREQKDGEHGWPGFDIKEFEIMEASLVSVPSNVDAEIEIVAGKNFESEYFKHYQKELVGSRKLVVPVGDSQLRLRFDGKSVEISSVSSDKEQVEPESIGVAAKQADAPAQSSLPPESREIVDSTRPVSSLDESDRKLVKLLEGLLDDVRGGGFGESKLMHDLIDCTMILDEDRLKDEVFTEAYKVFCERAIAEGEDRFEPNEADAVGFLLRCNDETILKRLRDIAAGRLELADRKALAKEVELLVGA